MSILLNLSRAARLKLLLIFILIVSTGLLRLFLLENINDLLYFLYYKTERHSLSEMLRFLRSFSYTELINIKWMITIAFTILQFFYSCWAIHLLFYKRRFLLVMVYLYAALVAVAFLFYFVGGLVAGPEDGYRWARYLMGMAQSPAPLLILIPVFTLSSQK